MFTISSGMRCLGVLPIIFCFVIGGSALKASAGEPTGGEGAKTSGPAITGKATIEEKELLSGEIIWSFTFDGECKELDIVQAADFPRPFPIGDPVFSKITAKDLEGLAITAFAEKKCIKNASLEEVVIHTVEKLRHIKKRTIIVADMVLLFVK